jgi:hypothetical protein
MISIDVVITNSRCSSDTLTYLLTGTRLGVKITRFTQKTRPRLSVLYSICALRYLEILISTLSENTYQHWLRILSHETHSFLIGTNASGLLLFLLLLALLLHLFGAFLLVLLHLFSPDRLDSRRHCVVILGKLHRELVTMPAPQLFSVKAVLRGNDYADVRICAPPPLPCLLVLRMLFWAECLSPPTCAGDLNKLATNVRLNMFSHGYCGC